MRRIYKIILAIEVICLILFLVGYVDYQDHLAKENSVYSFGSCSAKHNSVELNFSNETMVAIKKEGLNS